jgi:hypothetical protein
MQRVSVVHESAGRRLNEDEGVTVASVTPLV